jgi:hypothetical protein
MRIQHSRWSNLLSAVAAFTALVAISAIETRAANPAPTNDTLELRSPDGRIAVTVNPSGVLTYRVALVKADRAESNATWTNPLGKRRQVRDHPDNLRGQPGIDFFKLVPTVWDETRVLSGTVGDHLVMARRSDNDWFLGALNNDYTRVCATKLDFLGEGKWKMRWWHDVRDSSEKPERIEIEERTVTAGETLNLRLSPGGGAVIQFVPER